MNNREWKQFILQWSEKVAAQNLDEYAGERRSFDKEHGFGTKGASEESIVEVENKLGTKLPPSYREFLKASNGLHQPVESMATTGGDFWPAEEVDWFRVRNQWWIDCWTDETEPETPDAEYFVYGPDQDCCAMRPEYLKTALEISHDGDAGIYLLNPEVKDANGEWEAMHLASWMPGIERFRSFHEMMQEHYTRLESDEETQCFGF